MFYFRTLLVSANVLTRPDIRLTGGVNKVVVALRKSSDANIKEELYFTSSIWDIHILLCTMYAYKYFQIIIKHIICRPTKRTEFNSRWRGAMDQTRGDRAEGYRVYATNVLIPSVIFTYFMAYILYYRWGIFTGINIQV